MAKGHHRRLDRQEGEVTVEDIARVLVWANGGDPAEIAAAPGDVLVMDDAQQCLEDITEATS
jgi:hypothetical protein